MEKTATTVITLISTAISIVSIFIGVMNNNRVNKLEEEKVLIQKKDSDAKRAIDSLNVIANYETRVRTWREDNDRLANNSTQDKKITIHSNGPKITVCLTFYSYTGEWITRGYFDINKGELDGGFSRLTTNQYIWVSFYDDSRLVSPQRIKVNAQQLNDDTEARSFDVRSRFPFTIFQSFATPYAIEQAKFYRIDTSNESTDIVID